ncbi:MAG: zeta toxin family protein [Candidatus Parcubacteria bacterium]|nr:zeta toxin family protein [Candidatus Parcubacteria bacterium]
MSNLDISKEEALVIFHEMIVPQIIQGATPKEKEAFILGGQPGSGKSALAREIIKKDRNIIFINGDDLRAYHPKYYFYLKENDEEAADKTQAVCNFWVELLMQECLKLELNFMIEGTLRRREVSLNTAKIMKDANYSVNLAVVSTPYELSLLSLQYRYEELKKLGQPARFTKKESHDEAFRNSEETLRALVDSGFFSKFFVYKRHLGGFAENVFTKEQKDMVLNSFLEGRMRKVENSEKDVPVFPKEGGLNSFISK